ncbi:hypothetical protein GGI21_006341, partial [Coemansia aciculifera]
MAHRATFPMYSTGATHSSNKSDEVIGFIGLGQMGFNMAKHLRAKSNAPFIVYDLNRHAMENFQATSGDLVETATSPAELASRASVIVTVLPESAHVKEAYLGEAGIIRGVRRGTLCIDSSTIDTSVSIDVSSQ